MKRSAPPNAPVSDAHLPRLADPPRPLRPLALLALVLYPVVWLLLLPFRLAGIALHGVLELVRAVILLPVKILRLGLGQTRSG